MTAPRYELLRGETLLELLKIPDGSIDAVITDPPYSSGGAFRGDRMASTTLKYVSSSTKIERPDFTGDTRDQRAFAYWEALWLAECLRVSRPAAPLCVFTDWRQIGATIDAVQAGGWIYRGIVPWDKGEGVRPKLSRPRNQCEYIVWASNGPMPERPGVPVLPGCLRVPVLVAEKRHIAGKPIELMRAINRLCVPGGTILDPFAGSGSTGIAALLDGYRFVGIEREASYCAIAEAGLREAASAGVQRMLLDVEAPRPPAHGALALDQADQAGEAPEPEATE